MRRLFLCALVVLGATTVSSSAFALSPSTQVAGEGRVDGVALGDVDGSGDLESVVVSRTGSFSMGASSNGSVAVFGADGSLRWERLFDAPMVGTATLGDLDADGSQEIVVCELSGEGVCYALDGDGVELWTSDVFYYPGMTGSGPAIADVLGDSREEVVVASWGGELALLDGATGATVWWNEEAGTVGENLFGSPVIGDLDGDGGQEIVVLGYTLGGIRVYEAESGDSRWADSNLRVRYGNYAQASHVLLTDLDGERSTLEVVATLRGSDGSAVFGWSASGEQLFRTTVSSVLGWSSPIAADIDGDLRREILFATAHGTLYEIDQSGDIVRSVGLNATWPRLSLIDATGDGVVEVVAAATGLLVVLNGSDLSTLLSYRTSTPELIYPTPAVADADLDGRVELFTGNYDAKTFLSFELATPSEFRWTAIGGGSTHQGEHVLGSAMGTYSGRLSSVLSELTRLSEDPSLSGSARQKVVKAVAHVGSAIASASQGDAGDSLSAIRKAIHELSKQQDGSSAAPYQNELFAIAYEFTSDLLHWARDQGVLTEEEFTAGQSASTWAGGVFDEHPLAAALTLEALVKGLRGEADDFLAETSL